MMNRTENIEKSQKKSEININIVLKNYRID